MIVPIGSVGSVGNLGAGLSGVGSSTGTTAGAAEGVAPAEGLTPTEGAAAGEATQGGTPSFGAALTEAISSLQASQTSADAASQALATGSVANPEQAVSTVEDASMEMQLAAEIRAKASEAVNTIFSTQV